MVSWRMRPDPLNLALLADAAGIGNRASQLGFRRQFGCRC
jgi:hypothetical protein